MNKNELDARKAEHKAFGTSLMNSPEFRKWQAEHEALAQAEGNPSDDNFAAKMYGGYSDAETDSFRAPGDSGKRLYFGMKTAKALATLATKTVVPIASSENAIVGLEFRPDPIALGKPATGLLDVLPVVPHGSPQYAYLRQSTRNNNAAVWTTGNKPVSQYAVTEIETSLSIIAHTTEAIQNYWMLDNGTLAGWIQNELHYGLSKAVEAMALTAINGTSGIQTQTFSSTIPVTLRKSMTKLESMGYVAHSIVLHPNDFESIELALSTTNAVEHIGLPYDPAARRLYGVPIATTIAQTQGVGHVIGNGAVALDTDSLGVQLRWTDVGVDSVGNDLFSTNAQRARMEGRYGTSVYQPAGVVVATLA